MEQCANLAQPLRAHCPLVGKHADFDQFVAEEISVDLIEYRRAQTVITDHHDRIERVGAGAECAALG
jgi:hypothetical protein